MVDFIKVINGFEIQWYGVEGTEAGMGTCSDRLVNGVVSVLKKYIHGRHSSSNNINSDNT